MAFIDLQGTSSGSSSASGALKVKRALAGVSSGFSSAWGAILVLTKYLGRPYWTFTRNWAAGQAKQFDYDLRIEQLGFCAPRFEQIQSDVIRGFEFDLMLEGSAAIFNFEHWLNLTRGRLNGFWIASPFDAFLIMAGVDADEFLIQDQRLRDHWTDHVCQYLVFEKTGQRIQFAKIQSVTEDTAGRERVTLTTSLAIAVDSTWACRKLVYARLADDTERATLIADNKQIRKVRVIELPGEYAAIETGQQPVFLYEFWADAGGTPFYWRFTGLNEDIVSGGNTYQTAPIEHRKLLHSISGGDKAVTIESWFETGNPLTRFIPFTLPAQLYMRILETTYVAPNTTTVLFSGRVESVAAKGKMLTALCNSLLDVLGRSFPRMQVQPRCNYSIYSPPCGASKTQFDATVLIRSIQGRVVLVRQGAANSPDRFTSAPTDYFAGGWIEMGSGESFERRFIAHSSFQTADTDSVEVIELLLIEPFKYAAVGQSATIFAGCNGTVETCKTKFNNFGNFGGHPHVPVTNPSVRAMQAENANGNKK